MHRYALFAGQDYYADGGFDDFLDSSDSIIDLEIEKGIEITQRTKLNVEWAHIADLHSMKIVRHLKRSGEWHDGPLWNDHDLRIELPEYIQRYRHGLNETPCGSRKSFKYALMTALSATCLNAKCK